MLRFRDIVICPYVPLQAGFGDRNLRGGPLWPDWDKQIEARHCRGGRPVDTRPELNEDPVPVNGTFAWAGALLGHFGHQIADFSMRLLPTLVEWPEAVFAFSVPGNMHCAEVKDAPRFFHDILAWFGIPPERVVLITKPARVDEVVVAPQAEQISGPGPSPSHLDLMDELTARRLGRPAREGILYVSRAGVYARFAGEAYLERALRAAGVNVFRPEKFPLLKQLGAYFSAAEIVFSEGSAMHATQLLGRGLGDVHVLARRPGSKLGRFFLEPRARKLTFHDAAAGLVHGLDLLHRARRQVGLTIFKEERLLQSFKALGINLEQHWKSSDYLIVRDKDIRHWLRIATRLPGNARGSLEVILAALAAAGLAHFQPEVEEYWKANQARLARLAAAKDV
jgi:hypothetical protein